MKKKILFIYRADNIGITGVNAYFKDLILELKSIYSIDEYFQPEFKSLYISFLYMLIIAPIKMYIKSKKYDFIVITNDLLCNHSIFCLSKSIIVFHHIQQEVEERLNYSRRSFTDIILKAYRKFTLLISTKAKAIVVPSQFTYDQYILQFPHVKKKIRIIYNPFNLETFTFDLNQKINLFKKYNILFEDQKKYLLFVGTEAIRKNFITLLKVLKELKDSNYEIIKIGLARFEDNRLIHLKYIKENNLKVHFLDYVDQKDLIGFYKSCNVYINPSLFEGFGRTPIEAQICKLPVISTIEGALREVLEESAFLIYEPENINEYIKALKILKNTNKRDELITKGLINSERFSIKNIFNKWENLFEMLS